MTSLWQVIRNCTRVLARNGKLAILMGDARIRGQYLALPFRTMRLAMAEGLTLAAPEIIRCSYGTTSSHKKYNFSFIPRIHDVCLVLRHETDHLTKQPEADDEILDVPGQTRYAKRETAGNSREPDAARHSLQAVLQRQPGHPHAAQLMRQLDSQEKPDRSAPARPR